MEEDIQNEFEHVYFKLNKADGKQRLYADILHEQSVNDMTDIQEAMSDIIYNDINDELL